MKAFFKISHEIYDCSKLSVIGYKYLLIENFRIHAFNKLDHLPKKELERIVPVKKFPSLKRLVELSTLINKTAAALDVECSKAKLRIKDPDCGIKINSVNDYEIIGVNLERGPVVHEPVTYYFSTRAIKHALTGLSNKFRIQIKDLGISNPAVLILSCPDAMAIIANKIGG